MAAEAQAGDSDKPVRVFLWMVPRTVSMAFVRCIDKIPTCQIWIEPFGICKFAALNYTTNHGVEIPEDLEYKSNEDTYASMAAEFGSTVRKVLSPEHLV